MARGLEEQYETYLSRIPLACHNKVLDEDNDDVDTHLVRLAGKLSSWEGQLGVELGLTSTEISDIQSVFFREPSQARIKVLQKWKEKKGIEATYSGLLRIFLRSKRADLAREVVSLCKEYAPIPQQASNGTQPRPPAATAVDTVTLPELLAEVGIDEAALAVRCTVPGLDHIASKISPKNWDTYARALGLPENLLDDFREDNSRAKEQRFSGLMAWKQRVSIKAKYLALVKLFLEKNNAELAEEVCIYVKNTLH